MPNLNWVPDSILKPFGGFTSEKFAGEQGPAPVPSSWKVSLLDCALQDHGQQLEEDEPCVSAVLIIGSLHCSSPSEVGQVIHRELYERITSSSAEINTAILYGLWNLFSRLESGWKQHCHAASNPFMSKTI